jgi:hypothetical protein
MRRQLSTAFAIASEPWHTALDQWRDYKDLRAEPGSSPLSAFMVLLIDAFGRATPSLGHFLGSRDNQLHEEF